jgi:hypothetical protein
LRIDYSVDVVRDTLALNRPAPTPAGFLENFRYELVVGAEFQDMLANNMGWRIVSTRVGEVLSKCRNVGEFELLPLPEHVNRIRPELSSYRVLGIKRHVRCVDLEESDILWGGCAEGRRAISSFRECVLSEPRIPPDVDIFLLEEYPVMPIISGQLAMALAALRPTGFVFQEIRAVTHQHRRFEPER